MTKAEEIVERLSAVQRRRLLNAADGWASAPKYNSRAMSGLVGARLAIPVERSRIGLTKVRLNDLGLEVRALLLEKKDA